MQEILTALPTQNAEQTSQTALGTSEGFLDHDSRWYAQETEQLSFDLGLVAPNELPKRTRRLRVEPRPMLYDLPQHELPLGIGSGRFEIWATPRWGDCYGLVTPIDEETGLPIPILPTEPFSPNAKRRRDYHHLFHPEGDLIKGDDSEVALRRSFGQDLERWLHEHNHVYFCGPALPTTRDERYKRIVLACAGVVPRQAIQFTKHGPFHRESLTNDEYERMCATIRHEGQGKGRPGEFYRNQIGMFFANYAIEQQLEEVISQSVIDEFLNTTEADKRVALGNLMLREAIVMSIEPARKLHQKARSRGLLKIPETNLGTSVCKYFILTRRQDYFDALDAKFRTTIAA